MSKVKCLSHLPLSCITGHVHYHLLIIFCEQAATLPTYVCVDCSFMGCLLTDSDFGGSKFLCKFVSLLLDYTTSISEDEICVSGTWEAQISLYRSVAHLLTGNPWCTKMIQFRSTWMCACANVEGGVCSRE